MVKSGGRLQSSSRTINELCFFLFGHFVFGRNYNLKSPYYSGTFYVLEVNYGLKLLEAGEDKSSVHIKSVEFLLVRFILVWINISHFGSHFLCLRFCAYSHFLVSTVLVPTKLLPTLGCLLFFCPHL